jgi:Mrp family chromosome partitioning ATPase/predicted Fe-Mo cluster-binding NifX family protein
MQVFLGGNRTMDKCSQQKDNGSCESCELHHKAGEEAQTDEYQIRWTLEQIRHKLIIMSGKGGVGKSSVAVTLALTLARRGFAVGLIDVDLHGPDVLRMLGLGEPLGLVHGQFNLPADLYHNLQIISIEAMMKNRDAAVIWRGALKHKIIRQFLTEIEWRPLDFLIIDAPPGTGDEILTVARTIPEAQALIVTTPQEISLADVRKSINFCHKVGLHILGVVENMGHVICPHCGKSEPLFQSAGGGQSVQSLGLNLFSSLPFDPQVVEAADAGRLTDVDTSKSPFFQALNQIVDSILTTVGQSDPQQILPAREPGSSKFAMPVQDGQLSQQFGQSRQFALITVKDNHIVDQEEASPPDFKPGLLPAWLDRQGVTHIITAGLGETAMKFFQRKGIEVIIGTPALSPETLVQQYLDRQAATG